MSTEEQGVSLLRESAPLDIANFIPFTTPDPATGVTGYSIRVDGGWTLQ